VQADAPAPAAATPAPVVASAVIETPRDEATHASAATTQVQEEASEPQTPPPQGPAEPTLSVGLFQGKGVSALAFKEMKKLLEDDPNFDLTVLRGSHVRSGKLKKHDVVIFVGGSGSKQGQSLGEEGREQVRKWVRRGGGYIGICAGAYLTMQGEDEFNKLEMLAGHNKSGDFWKRGIAPIKVKVEASAWADVLEMHFANGPIFERQPVDGLPAYVELATYQGEIWSEQNGTQPGEMAGTASIVASRYGQGRMLLFSPNPILGGEGVAHPHMMLDGIRWASVSNGLRRDLAFDDVFAGPQVAE
jgi:hypothetical protein